MIAVAGAYMARCIINNEKSDFTLGGPTSAMSSVQGRVESINIETSSFVMKDEDSESVVYTSRTESSKAALRGIKTGEVVRVYYFLSDSTNSGLNAQEIIFGNMLN